MSDSKEGGGFRVREQWVDTLSKELGFSVEAHFSNDWGGILRRGASPMSPRVCKQPARPLQTSLRWAASEVGSATHCGHMRAFPTQVH